MGKRKGILAFLAIAACILAAGAGLSMAYMTDRDEASNGLHPVGEDGLSAVLTEPSWDPGKGLLVVPNESIPKDPQVTNTSEVDMDGLCALKAEFVYGKGCPDQEKAGKALSPTDMAYVCDVYQIDWNADSQGDWVRFEGESEGSQTQHFYYKEVLKRNYPEEGDTTVPLFTRITVPKEVGNQQYAHIQEMGGFDIRLSGMIVQQMSGERIHGLDCARDAYRAGLFTFSEPEA